MMVCAQVIGNDLVITLGNERGNFELNVMMPVMVYNLLQSLTILGRAARALADKAIVGLIVNSEHIARFLEQNPILVTALNPVIGYDKAAQIATEAYVDGRPVREVVAAETDLSPEQLENLLDPRRMT
jgi:fumarate hydratase class II